jgi:hypothetical protein
MVEGHAHDSYSGIFMDILLGGKSLKATDYFQALEISMHVGKAWTGTLTLYDTEGDYLDNLIFQSGYHALIDITFGLVTDPASHGVYHGSVLSVTPDFTPEGTTVVIEMIAKPLVGSLMSRENYSFPDRQKASAIVKKIADSEGWTTTDPQGNYTIEETEAELEFPLSANGESAYKFIKETIVPQAVSVKGKGDYKAFFDRKGAFHFHNPDFIEAHEIYYTFARGANGVVISFSPSDTGIFASLLGGGNAVYSGVDAKKGASTENTSDAATGMDGEGRSTHDGATASKAGAEGVSHREQVIARTEGESERRAKTLHDKASSLLFSAELMVHGTHGVEMLDFVTVDYIKKDGQKHFMSGKFRVQGLTQEVGSSGWETKMDLTRMGTPSVTGSVPHQSSGHSSGTDDTGSDSHSVDVD